MGRPRSQTITVRYAPNARRAKPWIATWRETDPATGTRRDVVRLFDTEADAVAFKTTHEAHAAALPPPPPGAVPAPRPRPTVVAGGLAGSTMRAATVPKGSLTLQQFGDDWLAHVVTRLKPKTQLSYRDLMERHIYPTLGTTRVAPATLGPGVVAGLVMSAAYGGMAWGTQKALIRVLSTCLSWAVMFEHLTVNPCAALIKKLKDKARHVEPEPNPLTADQAAAFLDYVRSGIVPGSMDVDGPRGRGRKVLTPGFGAKWYAYFYTLRWTGMRPGEAAALRWSSFDPTAKTLRIEVNYSPAAYQQAGGSGDVTTKSGKSRLIELGAAHVAILAALPRPADRVVGGRRVSPYLFVTDRGTRILPDSATARRIFARAMTAIGLEAAGHTIYDLRDTFATTHLAAGDDRLLWVSTMLGHADVSTTTRRYVKYVRTTARTSFADAIEATR